MRRDAISGPCPRCGGVLEHVAHPDGFIVERYHPGYLRADQALPERARLAPFVACAACEFCEEIC